MYRQLSEALAGSEQTCAGLAGIRIEPGCERGLVCRVHEAREDACGGQWASGVASKRREVG